MNQKNGKEFAEKAKKTKQDGCTTELHATFVEHVAQEDVNNSMGYNPEVGIEYDKAIEAVKGSYTEEELAQLLDVDKDALKSIIGTDNRDLETATRYPFSAICKLFIRAKNNSLYVGTGFMISPRVVVTAGHCVYLHNAGGWAQSIEVVPRLLGNNKPFGSASSSHMCSWNNWIKNKDTRFDIGVIVLPAESKLGNKTGWWGFGWRNPNYYKNLPITIAGYPGDKPRGEMWRMSGNDTSLFLNDKKMKYTIDTMGGQSGSPVWENINFSYYVLGVHTSGYGSFNAATRLDESFFNWLSSYKKKDLENKL